MVSCGSLWLCVEASGHCASSPRSPRPASTGSGPSVQCPLQGFPSSETGPALITPGVLLFIPYKCGAAPSCAGGCPTCRNPLLFLGTSVVSTWWAPASSSVAALLQCGAQHCGRTITFHLQDKTYMPALSYRILWVMSLRNYCSIFEYYVLFLKDFMYLFTRDTQREAETQAEGEAGSMQGARRGTRAQVFRVTPSAEGSAKPLSHPGCSFSFSLHQFHWQILSISLSFVCGCLTD